MANVGSAFVTLMPSMDGFGPKVSSQFSKAGTASGTAFSKSATAGTSGVSTKLAAEGQRAGSGFASGLSAGASAADGFKGKLAAVTGAAAGMASELAGRAFNAVANLASEMVSASDSAQKFGSTLSFAGLDSGTIEALTRSTQEYADRTVYDLNDIRNVTAQLASNSVKDFDMLAQAAGNLNAVAGGNAETFKSVGMVLTQTAGQGKLTTENWNQMADAIPGASGALQDAMRAAGAFEGNFRDAMAAGEISADEFFAAVQQLGMTDVAKEAATSTATIEGAVGNLQASVVGLGARAIDAVKPMVTGGITAVADGIASIPDKLSGFAGMVSGYLQPAADWIDGFKGRLADNGAVQAFQDALGGLSKTASTIGDAVGSAVSGVLGFATSSGTAQGAADLLKVALDGVKWAAEAVSSGVSWLKGNFDLIGPGIAAVTAGFVAFKAAMGISALISGVQTALAGLNVVQTVVTTAQAAMNAVMALNPFVLVATAVAALVAGFVVLWNTNEGFRTAVTSAWNSIKATAANVWTAVTDFFTVTVPSAISALQAKFQQLPDAIASQLSSVITRVATWAESMANKARSAAAQFGDNLMNGLKSLPDMVTDIGAQIIAGMVKGVVGAASRLIEAVSSAVGDAIAAAKNLLGIASPSKVFAQIGRFAMQGLSVGIDGSAALAVASTESAAAQMAAVRFGTEGPDYQGRLAPAVGVRYSANATDAGDLMEVLVGILRTLQAIYQIIPEGMTERDKARMVRRYA